jgi:glycosyltransferase involved in cell wall biosynthesis
MRSTPTEPHVLMMVANDISNDARVLKEAVALARTGLRVTLLGVAPRGGAESMEVLDGRIVMIRLAGAFPLRDHRNRRRARRRARRVPFMGYRHSADPAARQIAIEARFADLKAASGRAAADRRAGSVGVLRYRVGVASRGLRKRALGLSQRAASVREAATEPHQEKVRSTWQWWDERLANITWPVSWRRVVPEAYDYEKIFAEVIDELSPDVLHAHDMHLIGVAARAAGRAALRGRKVQVVYDAHEYVAGLSRYGGRTGRFIAAWAQHEREYIGAADRVITVSPAIARALQTDHRLKREPTVIMNTPSQFDDSAGIVDLRTRSGLAADVPLMVYSGGITQARGVETAIQALLELPGVHLAVVCVPSIGIKPVQDLRELAASLQVEDRVHYLNPVGPQDVVPFLRTADVGLIPILRYPSHEMALPNKVFEYLFAGLPVVTSNMQSLTEFMNETGVGEVFEVENPADLAAKVTRVLQNPAPYRERAANPQLQLEMSWEGQAAHLRELYGDLVGHALPATAPPAPPQVFIGPLNTAGQAARWAGAIERNHPGVFGMSMRIEAGKHDLPADWTVKRERYTSSLDWKVATTDYLLNNVSHVLSEGGRPILGDTESQWFGKDLPLLDAAGIKHGVIFHGPEVRDPARHRDLYPHSPFADPGHRGTVLLQASVDRLKALLADYDGPRFVATPDLLDYVEGSIWLPAVVNLDSDLVTQPVLERDKPVVLHALSRTDLKGTAVIDTVLSELQAEGRIEYQRVGGVRHDELGKLVQDADIVVDQLLLGTYGAFAVEAMAAGRVTVGHVAKHVRDVLPTQLPIVEATPETLRDVIEQLVTDRAPARAAAQAGYDYAKAVHDGRRSAEALSTFITPPTGATT